MHRHPCAPANLLTGMLRPLLLSGLLLLPYNSSIAADLLEVFTLAEIADPAYLEAQAEFRATLENKPQARAALLPQLSLSANTFSNDQNISGNTFAALGQAGDISFNSHGYSLDLVQPLFRASAWLQYRQVDSIINQAEAELLAARQDLALRVSERYFDILAARDNLEFARAEARALQRQLEQAEKRLEVGLGDITDVQEARAGHDRATAAVIAAENALGDRQEELREITGEYVQNFAKLDTGLPLLKPTPEDIDSWTATALAENLEIIAAEQALETARREIGIQRSEHLPTLDLVARSGYDKTGGRFGNTQINNDAIGLELNVPLFKGGLVTSQTRAAQNRYDASVERLHRARRESQSRTRQAYSGVLSGISQVRAFEQAVVSSQTALEATTAGFEVGSRTAVDVVTAERALSDARRNLAQARYEYLVNSLRLKQAAGILADQDLALINRWLQ